MRINLATLVLLTLIATVGHAQSTFVTTGARSIKTEHTPKPREFKVKTLGWGELSSDCVDEAVETGAWFKFYPKTSRLKVTISTGLNWGTVSNPMVYIGYVDTIDGVETLVQLGCQQFEGTSGDFDFEALNLYKGRKHYLLVSGGVHKDEFAIYLTEKFSPTQVTAFEEVDNKAVPADDAAVQVTDNMPDLLPEADSGSISTSIYRGTSVIIGRIRKENGKAIEGFGLQLLNDDLRELDQAVTDEGGVFRFNNVNAALLNLVRTEADDQHLLIDMFLYDEELNIIGKPIALGHRLYSFRGRQEGFQNINILTEKDLVVLVKKGKSSMTGKVVDRSTFLIGKEGVRVGLYTPKKHLIRTAFTDMSGMFLFTQLENEEYIVKVDHNPTDDFVEIVITDDQNVPYAFTNSNIQDDDGYFRFRKLPMDAFEIVTIDDVDPSGFAGEKYNLLSEALPGRTYELHSIEFSTGSSRLAGTRNDELDQLARELQAQINIRIKIDGHTDNVGSESSNQRLSRKRAEAVKAYLVKQGVDHGRIACEGFGSTKPIADNSSEAGRNLNRRVEFSIVEK